MVRDRTARMRVRQYLASSGPILDPSGLATAVLKQRIGYKGSSVAFIQLIAAMERDEEIVREIRGKRTYRIEAAPRTDAHPDPEPDEIQEPPPAQAAKAPANTPQLDYDTLAKAIVTEFWAAATQGKPPADEATDSRSS